MSGKGHFERLFEGSGTPWAGYAIVVALPIAVGLALLLAPPISYVLAGAALVATVALGCVLVRELQARSRLLRSSRERVNTAQEAARLAIWELDAATGAITWSPGGADLYGRAIQTHEDWKAVVHPDDHWRFLESKLHAIQSGEPVRDEFRIVRPDGSELWLGSLSVPFKDDAGKVTRLLGVHCDITPEKQSQQRLAGFVLFSEQVINSAPYGIIVFDRQHRVMVWNPAQERISGLKKESVLGKSVLEIFPFIEKTGLTRTLKSALLGETVAIAESPFWMDQSGRSGTAALHFRPLRDAANEIVGVLVSMQDISEVKRGEQVLRQNEKLAAAGRLAATLAHEINNPLATVNNLIYLIEMDADLPPTTKQLVTMAHAELQRVVRITQQTLGFYREAASPVDVDLADVVDDVAGLSRKKLAEAGIEMKVEIKRRDVTVHAYPGEMRQVLLNLVSNAADAMPRGGKLALRLRPATERKHEGRRRGVRILVADSGPGIPEEHVRRLAEPFFTTKGEKGTGLGLWVTRSIVAKHEGTLRIRTSTRAGRSGTSFWIFLPFPARVERSHAIAAQRAIG